MRIFLVLFSFIVLACGSSNPVADANVDESDSSEIDTNEQDTSELDSTEQDEPDTSEQDTEFNSSVLEGEEAITALIEQFCEATKTALCEELQNCACLNSLLPDSFEQCVATGITDCSEDVNALRPSFLNGEAIVHQEHLSRCVDLLLESLHTCNDFSDTVGFAFCRHIVASTVPVGDACSEFFACGSGNGVCLEGQCVALPNENETCSEICGDDTLCINEICVSWALLDENCGENQPCHPSLHCDQNSETCIMLGNEGDPCVNDSECAAGHGCETGVCINYTGTACEDNSCAGNNQCYGSSERMCVSHNVVGASCERKDDCAGDLVCVDLICTQAPALGEPCNDGVYCAEGLACAFDFASGAEGCALLPELGASCALGVRGPSICADGLGCVENTCVEMPQLGDPCTVDNRCAEDLGCDFTRDGSFCATRRGSGEHCDSTSVCLDGLFCDFEVLECTPFYELGETCSQGGECGEGRACLPNAIGDYQCTINPEEGDSCVGTCADGLFCEVQSSVSNCAPAICDQ